MISTSFKWRLTPWSSLQDEDCPTQYEVYRRDGKGEDRILIEEECISR
jgi:hypothetical protein